MQPPDRPVSFADAVARGLQPDGALLVVSAASQELSVLTGDGLWRRFPVSTARKGIGNRNGSYATPPGWHRVAERVGAGAPAGQVFRSRRPTCRVLTPDAWRSETEEDCITSRILRLAGLEPGVNQGPGIDSFDRFIYIHGTNREQGLGSPVSHGCIRMANPDVIALFAFVESRETWCWIG